MTRQLHLNLFLHDTGHHERLARLAESGTFDSLFLADLSGGPGWRVGSRSR